MLLATLMEGLRADDRALCNELTLGVLRWQLWLDRVLEHYAGRSAASLDAPVRRALRLGLYQLRFLTRVPASAAVNESVNLAYAARVGSAAGFINAVLRRATREPEYDPAAAIVDEVERIAVETSHPAWLIARWTEALGADDAKAFAHANNRTPPVGFRVNPLRAEVADVIVGLRETGGRVEASRIAPGAWRARGSLNGAALRQLATTGLVYLQDEASQLVAHVLDAQAGERVLDVCAAPGSKTTHIAALMGDVARIIVAGDRHEHRLRTVDESARVQGLQGIHTLALDAERPLPVAAGAFERVLVDAPCTGTGTLRHNPELRWRITAPDIAELAARQRSILDNAAHAVGAGGRLVYSTCSVEREENEDVVAWFLERHGGWKQVAAAPASDALMEPSGAARTWPHRDDVDGFFVAALERT